MRNVAKYSLTSTCQSPEEATSALLKTKAVIDTWLDQKGTLEGEQPQRNLRLKDGRLAEVEMTELEVDQSKLSTFKISEPNPTATFETLTTIACHERELAVHCLLKAGTQETRIAPMNFDAYCPKFIKRIVDLGQDWHAGGTPVSLLPTYLRDRQSGVDLSRTLQDRNRTLPIILVSEYEGFQLHPELDTAIASDLCGLATVIKIDEEAAWTLTETLGREWSCFHGAVRIYWPGLHLDHDPFYHPLWTADRLIRLAGSNRAAASRIRNTLRRKLLALSTLTVHEPECIAAVQQQLREQKTHQLREAKDYDGVIRLVENERDEALLSLMEKQEVIETQLQIIDNQETTIRHLQKERKRDDEDSVLPEIEIPPQTVADAVNTSKSELSDTIVFGLDVDAGVKSLSPDAGPPSKILLYLRKLAELTQLLRDGNVGTGQTQWLTQQGCTSTDESKTTLRNSSSMARRTWDDGSGSKTKFSLHMKPAEGTHPDRCVRIYFTYDRQRDDMIVGWVGRHPD